MATQDVTQTTRRAPFLEAAQENYIDLLTQQVGRAPGSAGVPTLAELGPQVAGVDPLTQAAQQRIATQAGLGALTFGTEGQVTGVGTGTGVAGFEPFLNTAQQFQAAAGTAAAGAGAKGARYPRPGHDSRHAGLKPAVRKKLARKLLPATAATATNPNPTASAAAATTTPNTGL